MRKLILVVHTSLDGFVAGPSGELDGFPSGDENLGFVCGLTDEADTMLLGRVSFQLLDSFWPKAQNIRGATKNEVRYSNWYNDAQKIVLSKTLKADNLIKTTIISEDMPGKVRDLKQQSGKNILVFGSPAVSRQLMQLDLLDEYWIFINPVIFGAGIPLFQSAVKHRLKMLTVATFGNGEVAVNYRVER